MRRIAFTYRKTISENPAKSAAGKAEPRSVYLVPHVLCMDVSKSIISSRKVEVLYTYTIHAASKIMIEWAKSLFFVLVVIFARKQAWDACFCNRDAKGVA